MAYIYKITNTINGKLYVGQTRQLLKERWKEHCQQARKFQRGKTYALYDAMKEYGVDNFTIEVLQECKEEDLDRLEIEWIAKLDTFNNGYNMTKGGQEWGERRFEKWYNKSKHVSKYTLQGEFIVSYESIREASLKESISARNLRGHLKNRTHVPTVKGFIYALDSDTSYIEEIRSGKVKIKLGTGCTVKQYDLEGNYIATYNSCPEAAKAVGTTGTQIGDCINHTKGYKTAGGFQWCKEGEEDYIKVIRNKRCGIKQKISATKDGVTLTFNSIKEASKALGVSQTSIISFCSGIVKTNNLGYTFKIISD